MIKYRVVVSKLVNNPTGFTARVASVRTVGLEEIAAEIAHLGTTVSESDVLNVIRHYNDVIAWRLVRGETVITPAVHYRASIRGPWVNEAESFDPERHEIAVNLSPGPLLRRAMRDARAERYEGGTAVPRPKSYIDTFTGAQNDVVTPGQVGQLLGRYLRFDPTDPIQGVFFLDEAGGETRVPAMALIKPSQLLFNAPALAAGRYRLEVRSLVSYNGEGELHAGRLSAELTVS